MEDKSGILIDFKQLKEDWNKKEIELLNSDDYRNADKMEKEEMLYLFSVNENDAISEAMKVSNSQLSKLKNAFYTLMNYCNSRCGDCSDCVLCDISKDHNSDTKCLLDNFQCLTNSQIDSQIEKNFRKLQHQLNAEAKNEYFNSK